MDVGALTLAVEDHDDLGRPVDRSHCVGSHSRELGGFPGLDHDLTLAEIEAYPSLDDEEPVVTGVHTLLGWSPGRLETHLDRTGSAGRSAQEPGRVPARPARRGADHDVVVPSHVEERVEIDLERPGQGDENVEADRPFSRLHPADGGGAEVGAGGELVERQAQGGAQASQAGTHHLFDFDFFHWGSLGLANLAKTLAL